MNNTDAVRAIESLIEAVNRHDLDALVERFVEDVTSDTPAHPARSFVGREQVRRNWGQILGAIADLRATIVASATSPGPDPATRKVWAELAFDGHRPDGAPWQMRGVIVNEVAGGRIAALHFYMEPVEAADGAGVDAVIRQSVGATPSSTMAATR
jgi:ketosteroid isomerase-like protein